MKFFYLNSTDHMCGGIYPSTVKVYSFIARKPAFIYDNNYGLWYILHGDYYLPCLAIPEDEVHTIGIWSRKHQQYLKE